MRTIKQLGLLLVFMASSSLAQELCPQSILDSSYMVSFEGHFVNRENNRSHIDIIWKHFTTSPDSFELTINGSQSFLYVTTPDYRYVEILPQKIKRQMAYHHLKEFIASTPLRWDDLELLANGYYFCDNSASPKKILFTTAFSQMWFSITLDQPKQPTRVKTHGARGENREYQIHSWKNFNGALLPAMIEMRGPDYSGSLWVRSATHLSEKRLLDPILKNAKQHSKPSSILPLLGVGFDGEVKVPLILQMD